MANVHKISKIKGDNHTLLQSFDPLLTLQHDLSKTMSHFYDLFEPKQTILGHFEDLKLSPLMDFVEMKDHFRLEVEMPGLNEKDIRVTIHDNLLTIIGEKSVSKKDANKNFIDREIRYGSYERTIALPQTADWDHISASFKKGMLWVTIPKKASKKRGARDVKICCLDETKKRS